MYDEMRPHLDQMWRSTTQHQRQVIRRVLQREACRECDQPTVRQLVSKGYIVIQDSQGMRVTAKSLERYIQISTGFDDRAAIVLYVLFEPGVPVATIEEAVVSLSYLGIYYSRGDSALLVRSDTADEAVEVASQVGKVLRARRIRHRVLLACSDEFSDALSRRFDGTIIGHLDDGEMAVTFRAVQHMSKPISRRFRKRPAVANNLELPRLYTLRPQNRGPQHQRFGVPSAGENNVWFIYDETDTVFVFVHGIFSDSANCWRNGVSNTYWPEIIYSDERFDHPAQFMGGFYTHVKSNEYDLEACEHELFSALERPSPNLALSPVMEFNRILFICHSTGGLVVRYMLDARFERFKEKRVGVVLLASPSYGAKLADKLGWLARVYKNRLGQQLQWKSWSLRDLDSRFKRLVAEDRLPRLCGVEAYENKFIIQRRFLPNLTYVVEEESAGRYFGPAVLLRDTDHFSVAKPNGTSHPSHELLVDFYIHRFKAE